MYKQDGYIKRGEVDPYPPGTRVKLKPKGIPGTVLKECSCTINHLHYEVKFDGVSNVMVPGHEDLEKIPK